MIRVDTWKTYLAVHTWTGIVTGLALFIAFYAGALTMFKAPLLQWATPPAHGAAGSVAEAGRLLEQVWAERPASRTDSTLYLGGDDEPSRVSWRVRGEGLHWATLGDDGRLVEAPYRPSGLPDFIDNVHRTAGLPVDPDLGAAVMGVVSAVYALALVSGVIVLLPTLLKDVFALRLGRNLKRLWLDAHNVIGIASLPFHLVMALTAVVFGLHDVIYDVQDRAVYQGKLHEQWDASGPFAAVRRDPTPAQGLPLPELLGRLEALAPQMKADSLNFRAAGTAGAAVMIRGHEPCCLQRAPFGSLVVLGAVDGHLINGEYLPGYQSGWAATFTAFFSLHFGNFGGATVQWSYFFLGLGGAFLFYSGNLIWIETRRRRAARGSAEMPRQRRATRWMASGTVGASLGCMAGLSLAIVCAKALHGRVDDPGAWQQASYYLVFVGATVWAFVRGAPRAAVDLLGLTAALTALIPVVSLTGWIVPATGWWASGGPALGVDIVAALGAGLLVLMARATRRRLAAGATDSVWSARGPAAAMT